MPCTRGNGQWSMDRNRETVGEFRFGKMDPGMMGSGRMEWLMVEEGWYMLMVMCILVSGSMTRLMVMVFK